ncbi:monosaccharide ABC transporter substrate-binding protein (CUT2 family) [Salana multivorans]|uniref:Monosaccharide ABC transporter substrate-binding protein (CUT2 family) n=1 Tax=Salana multivorans TaxID=120377 RepID=A0A3N2D8V9_9MICO|nr:substrate-binding domain-containing protein [Salana multivorans]ROR96223.1 monosaccharide ABC transporter substrate-binding protein (CUT2 family) [Salana multivorans]
MKKLLSLATVGACALLLAACGGGTTGGGTDATTDGQTSTDAPAEGGVIGVIPKSTLYDYWTSVQIGAENAAKENGYTIAFQGTATDTDSEGQVKIVEDFITRGVEAIVISPVDPDALVPALERADAAGIPVVIIDGQLNSDVPRSTVSTDNVAAGALAAQNMAELIGEPGEVAVVNEVAGSVQGMAREEGFTSQIEKDGYSLLNTFFSEGDRNKALNITQDIFSSHPGIKGIFATNEGTTVGVSLGVSGADKAGEVVVVGFDSSDDILQAIRDGVVSGTVTQDPAGIGFAGVTNAIKAIRGESVDAVVDVPAAFVDATNIDDKDVQQVLKPART